MKLAERVDKIRVALDAYDPESGETLRVTVEDINFLVGACDSLVSQYQKLDVTHRQTFKAIEKKERDYKELRKIANRLSEKVTKYQQVIQQVYKIRPFFRPSSLKAELNSLENMQKSWRD